MSGHARRIYDVLVVGAGPAGLALAAALCERGLAVISLAPDGPDAPWPNTYGIWADELEPLGLTHLLGKRWQDTTVHAAGREFSLDREYGLFDNERLQSHLLDRCRQGDMTWEHGLAAAATHETAGSQVTMRDRRTLAARVIVDASGHRPALVTRPAKTGVAYQTAFGVVGTFSKPPVRPGQLTLMDYRADHLPEAERAGPPTFLYAMDLGDGAYFVEETSLAGAPPVGLDLLERRLALRLAAAGTRVLETRHVERCAFPMNLPLPHLNQPVLGYGGAASFVHPATGYQVGAALRRAPAVAAALADGLGATPGTPRRAVEAAWRAVWPRDRVRRRYLYLFGLANVLRFDEQAIHGFFASFFDLPRRQWSGYLSDDLTTAELLGTMWGLFRRAPRHVRRALGRSITSDGDLLWRALRG